MGQSLADRYGPDEVIAVLNRRRTMKTAAVLGGIILAVGVLIAAAAAMYSEEPSGTAPVPAAEP